MRRLLLSASVTLCLFLSGCRGPAGPPGPPGPAGERGPVGPPGPPGQAANTADLTALRARVDRLTDELEQLRSAKPVATARSLPSPQVGLTKSHYDRLQDGISYQAAVRIIGGQGDELSRNTMAGIETVMYMWHASNGANMMAMFQDGRLVQKAQFGLK